MTVQITRTDLTARELRAAAAKSKDARDRDRTGRDLVHHHLGAPPDICATGPFDGASGEPPGRK